MPVRSGRVSVGTTATPIPVTSSMPFRLEIKNLDNTDDVYIGNVDVTTSNGLLLARQEPFEMSLAPLDIVNLVSTKVGHQVAYIILTQVQ